MVALVVVIGTTNLAHGQLVQNFGGGGSAYTTGTYVGTLTPTINSNGPAGNTTYLRMEDSNNNENNAIYFDRVNASSYGSISGSFDFRIFNGTAPPADGFGLLFLSTGTYGNSGVPATLPTSLGAVAWERPVVGGSNPVNPSFANAVGFSANIYNGNPISQSGVYFNDTTLTSGNPTPGGYTFYKGAGTDGGTAFDRATFSLDLVNHTFSLSIAPNITGTPVTLYSNFSIPGLVADNFRLGLGTRTGGLNQTLDLTNFNVNFTPVPEPTSFALAGVGLVAFVRFARRKTAATD
jgi:PEP-CTERM motif